jgi:hypothetical protein
MFARIRGHVTAVLGWLQNFCLWKKCNPKLLPENDSVTNMINKDGYRITEVTVYI